MHIISADPGAGDEASPLIDVANALAYVYDSRVITVPLKPDQEDWTWDDISSALFDNPDSSLGTNQESISQQENNDIQFPRPIWEADALGAFLMALKN